MEEITTRRRFLQVSTTAAAIAVAGCGTSGSDGTEPGGTTDGGMTEGGMTPDGQMTEDGEMTGDGMSESRTVTVRIENVAPTDFYPSDTSTGGQIWITPGAFAVHTDENPMFTPGEAASVGLEALAEAGPPTGFPNEPGLVDELAEMEMGVVASGAYTPENTVADPNDPKGSVPGAPPIAPGGAFEFDVQARPGQNLSVASMFVPSNDLFFAPGTEGIPLWPMDGSPTAGDVSDRMALWDAGTEPNQQPGVGPDQAPAQSSPDQGADEGGVVRRLSEVDDGYTYPDVTDAIEVTLTPQ